MTSLRKHGFSDGEQRRVFTKLYILVSFSHKLPSFLRLEISLALSYVGLCVLLKKVILSTLDSKFKKNFTLMREKNQRNWEFDIPQTYLNLYVNDKRILVVPLTAWIVKIYIFNYVNAWYFFHSIYINIRLTQYPVVLRIAIFSILIKMIMILSVSFG